jgi:hypothetical protein
MVAIARRRTARLFLCVLAFVVCAGGCLAAGGLTAVADADTGNPLLYYGGPVEHSVTTVLVDWGAGVNPIFTNATTGDPGLLKYFASQSGDTDDNGGVLAQYMDSSGMNAANQESYAGQFQIAPTVPGTTVSDAQVASQLVSQIGSGALPAPAGNGLSSVYLVLFPPGTTICDAQGCSGQAFCSYHGSTQMPNGTNVIYDVLPDDTTGAMTQGCGVESPLRNQTMYLSHELAEAIADPLVDGATSYGPPLAWYDANCPAANSACGEVADKCNQQTTVEGGWTVQLLWSNLDGACVGNESRYGTPSITLTPPTGVAPGAPASFSAAASDPASNSASASWDGQNYAIAPGIASVTWNWGDGTPATTGPTAVHAFTSPGIYDVSATATDNLGFASTATEVVPVWGPLGAPAAQTGVAAGIGRTSARLQGTVDPAGLAVGYRFDFGTASSSLTASTAVATGPSGSRGSSAVPVALPLANLAPGTRYFYRLDVILGTQTLPGAIESFTTTLKAAGKGGSVATVAAAGKARKAKAAKRRRKTTKKAAKKSHVRTVVRRALVAAPTAVRSVSAVVVPGQRLATELRRGMLVSFHCGGCHVSLEAMLALPGRLGVASVPRVLASGAGVSFARTGAGRARLQFSASARAWLATRRSASFTVSAFSR